MIEDLATDLSTTLAVASMLFFVVVYLIVTVRTFSTGADELDARAHLALDPPPPGARWVGDDAVAAGRDDDPDRLK